MSCARKGMQCYLGGCRLIGALITDGQVLCPGKTTINNKQTMNCIKLLTAVKPGRVWTVVFESVVQPCSQKYFLKA